MPTTEPAVPIIFAKRYVTIKREGTQKRDSVLMIVRSPWSLLLELEFGKVLGVGTFGVVCEINGIELSHRDEDLWSNASQAETETTSEGPGTTATDGLLQNSIAAVRELIARRCLRYGEARYAVKKLKGDLDDFDAVAGRVDLAVEVKLLHALSHPNIVKMRGVFATDDPFHPNFFFVMDRLYGTLEDRIQERKQYQKSCLGRFRILSFVKRGSGDLPKSSTIERLVMAYDIASALRYMHSHNLVYRDVKPENVGFDVRGNVKVFDFGLARPLDPELRNAHGMYHLTARTGSIPYMAPEVAMMEPYNEKCDVFSFTILLWEILSLDQAFSSVVNSSADYYQHVVENHVRPPIARKWPPMVKHLMQSAWKELPQMRPSMTKVCSMLQGQLVSMTTDEKVRGRSLHMLDQSAKSLCLSK